MNKYKNFVLIIFVVFTLAKFKVILSNFYFTDVSNWNLNYDHNVLVSANNVDKLSICAFFLKIF